MNRDTLSYFKISSLVLTIKKPEENFKSKIEVMQTK